MIADKSDSSSSHIAIELGAQTTNIAWGLDCNQPMSLKEYNGNMPAAALLPQVIGEPVRADILWPPSPRGLGRGWPQQSVVSSSTFPGRMPASYAWQLLRYGSDWLWKSPTSTAMPVKGAQAIVSMAHQAAYESGNQMLREPEANRSTIILPISNALSEINQQQLIDASQEKGIELCLLWRPIAAALAWCDQHRKQLLEIDPAEDGKIGTILVGYFGLAEFERTQLEIIARDHAGHRYFLPGRRRPNPDDVTDSFGFQAFHHLATEVLRKKNIPATSANLWRLLWCSNWLQDTLEKLTASDDGLNGGQRLPADAPSLSVRETKEIWQIVTNNLAVRGNQDADKLNYKRFVSFV